jgi:hypothetical protein
MKTHLPKCPNCNSEMVFIDMEMRSYFWCGICMRNYDYEVKLTRYIGSFIPPVMKREFDTRKYSPLPRGIKDR